MYKAVPKSVNTSNVFSQPSKIPNGGTGLFAKIDIPHGSVICTYAGRLYDASEAVYRDPTYMVNFELGKGFKLDGDGADGDIGHYANATQINDEGIYDPPLNARFCMKSKKQWVVVDDITNETYFRGRFDLVARKDIKAGDEIILDYGKGYWRTMHEYWDNGPPSRSDVSVARDARAKRRLLRIRIGDATNNTLSSVTTTESTDGNITRRAANNQKKATSTYEGIKTSSTTSKVNFKSIKAKNGLKSSKKKSTHSDAKKSSKMISIKSTTASRLKSLVQRKVSSIPGKTQRKRSATSSTEQVNNVYDTVNDENAPTSKRSRLNSFTDKNNGKSSSEVQLKPTIASKPNKSTFNDKGEVMSFRKSSRLAARSS